MRIGQLSSVSWLVGLFATLSAQVYKIGLSAGWPVCLSLLIFILPFLTQRPSHINHVSNDVVI